MTPWNGAAKGEPGRTAFAFVLLIGILSFFADFAYEGSRSIIGPYLATFGASALVVGFVTGFGEFLGYALRLVSGRAADRTGKLWPITIFGYVIQMLAVPALALTGNWPTAAALIILERIGKATRNPPRDVMLSHAGSQVGGLGWVFGINETLDQAGAMCGPLVVAAVLAIRGSYREAFAVLLVQDRAADVHRCERQRRTPGALVHRDKNALGARVQRHGAPQRLRTTPPPQAASRGESVRPRRERTSTLPRIQPRCRSRRSNHHDGIVTGDLAESVAFASGIGDGRPACRTSCVLFERSCASQACSRLASRGVGSSSACSPRPSRDV